MTRGKLRKTEERYQPGDYRLKVDLESARESILKSLPDFPLKSIELFGEGLGNTIFLVNGDYMFKFAKHEKASKGLGKEIRLLPRLRERITFPIPNPEYEGQQSENGFKFFGYKQIKGVGLKKEHIVSLDEEGQTKLAKQLADFLTQIRSIDLNEARQWGVEEINPKTFYARRLKKAREIVYPILEAQDSEEAAKLKSYIEDFFESYLSDAKNFNYKPVLVHSDLEGHMAIIYDPEKQEISGIVDAGGPQINDPDLDLWRLYAHYGQEFVEKLLQFCPSDNPERLYKKLDFFWRAQTVHRAVRTILLKDEKEMKTSLEKFKEKAKDYKGEK